MHTPSEKFDVIIAGAGPAGSTCALALKDAGLKVVVVEKSSFPRDKVCGDAIPGRAVKILKSIDPEYGIAMRSLAEKYETRSTALHYDRRQLIINWAGEAYTSPRIHFDNFLFGLMQRHAGATIITGDSPQQLIRSDGDVLLSLASGRRLQSPLIIGADGAHSFVGRSFCSHAIARDHHVASVRAYYSGVQGLDENTNEVYFDKRYLPSYLWVFPIPGGLANVGFGMLSAEIVRRKINIKQAFYAFINNVPALREKFSTARQEGSLEGFGLPLGSLKVQMSGDNFMLAGDAASLIDPITGEGIGNAMLSGKLAAERAIRCHGVGDFAASFMGNYDAAIDGALGSELKARYKAQRLLFRFPFLLDAIFTAGQNKFLRQMMQQGL